MATSYDSYGKRAGEIFRKLRKEKGLSQEQVSRCKDISGYICSEDTIRRFEKSGKFPSVEILTNLLYVIGVDYVNFMSMVEGVRMLEFRNHFDTIWKKGFTERFQEMKEDVEVLKTRPYCNMDNPIIQQAILLCKGLFQRRIDKNPEQCLETLRAALCITTDGIIKKQGGIDYNAIMNRVLTLNEYRILNTIANQTGEQNNEYLAIQILKSMTISLNNEIVDNVTRDEILPIVYYNLSDSYINNKNFQDGFDACEKGITFCKANNVLKMLGELTYNKGKSLHLMGRIDEAIEYFKSSYEIFVSVDNRIMLKRVKDKAKEKYNLLL